MRGLVMTMDRQPLDPVEPRPLESLDELQEAANEMVRARRRRDELILAARLDGWPWASIADVVGLTVSSVSGIGTHMNGGTPPVPRQKRRPTSA